MIARLFLAALAVALTAAQQEFIMHTNGTGGVECGKYHHCITNTTCENIEGVHMCECKSDTTGNAKIHCLPHEHHNVWIQNDPHLKNFHKEFASLLTPCRYRVLSLLFEPDTESKAVVELFGENMLYKGGEYYLTKLTLSVTVNMGAGLMKQIMEFKGDVVKSVFGEWYNYTLIGESLDTSLIAEDEADAVPFEEGPFIGFTMDVEKDDDNNMLTVKVESLGISLFFRPPTSDEKLDNKHLPMVPGAVFNVDKEHWKLVNIEESQYDIASWPMGPSLEEKATEKNISKPMYVQYLMLENSKFFPVMPEEDMCTNISKVFHDVCDSPQKKLDVLHTCTSIYMEKEFLECLTEKNSHEEYVSVHKEFFGWCQYVLCDSYTSASECKNMKEEMSSKTKCHLPKKIDALDCDSFDA